MFTKCSEATSSLALNTTFFLAEIIGSIYIGTDNLEVLQHICALYFFVQYFLRNKANISTVQELRHRDNLECTFMYNIIIQ